MWNALLPRLRCPLWTGSLRALAFQEVELPVAQGAKEMRLQDGALLCDTCRTWYPVASYVPVLLDFPTPLHASVKAQHGGQLAALEGYSEPRGRPRPGELAVQKSFTEEWNVVRDDALTFNWDDEDLLRLHKEVWFGWDRPPAGIGTILNVGCGFGKEALVLQRICPDADVVAVDLNLSILGAGPLHANNRRLHSPSGCYAR